MKIALCQQKNEGTIDLNLKKCIESIKIAKENNADLVLFPEVHLTEFFPQYQNKNVNDYKLELDSKIVQGLIVASKENNIAIVPNIYLKQNDKTYDASLYIDPNGAILGIQKMVHIAQAYQFYEQDYYDEADDGFKVFDTPFGKIGIVVCFDRHYPESIRTEALMGANLILIPTVNTKREPSLMFEIELKCQAFQNSVFIAMCNRVGTEGEMEFSGESIIVDPNGNTIIKADDNEQIIYAEIDLSESKRIREEKPYTTLRKTKYYL